MVRREFPEVTLIAATSNLGFAKGNNLACSHARGRHVLYLNPDTELVTNAVRGMATLLDGNPMVGMVGCRLLNSDGSVQFTCASAFPSFRNELASLLFLNRLFPRSRLLSARELGYWDHMDSRSIDCLSGACLMIPRALAERLQGFDENLFMYGEDLDLCARVRADGRSLYYLASEVIYHHEGAGTRKRSSRFAPLRQRAANAYFIGRHFGEMRALTYRGAVTIGSLFRMTGATLGMPWLVFQSGWDWATAKDFIGLNGDLFLWSVGLKNVELRAS
jgi:GT2 family glycosyltransferase